MVIKGDNKYMAIWQVSFHIISKSKKDVVDRIIEDNMDKIILWEDNISSLKSLDKISELLPLEKSWSSSIIQYGSLEESCIKILLISDSSFELSCRIDIRSLSKECAENIIEFIKDNKAVILYNEKYYDPTMNNLKEILLNSKAHKFCSDSERFLKDLKQ